MELDQETIDLLLHGVPTWKMKAIEDKITDCLFILERQYNRIFIRPEVFYDLKGRTAGKANYRRMRLNVDLLNSDHWEDMLNSTIPHELAHSVQRQLYPTSQSHGVEWQRIMRYLGLKPERCHSYDVKPARVTNRPHLYACGCRTHKMTNLLHRKMQAGQYRRCKLCKGKLIWVQDSSPLR